ncbi:MAG: hypothetical protein ACNS61_02405, partial [Candidatus Wenzhouxiangella sp. M2_3B_020]
WFLIAYRSLLVSGCRYSGQARRCGVARSEHCDLEPGRPAALGRAGIWTWSWRFPDRDWTGSGVLIVGAKSRLPQEWDAARLYFCRSGDLAATG